MSKIRSAIVMGTRRSTRRTQQRGIILPSTCGVPAVSLLLPVQLQLPVPSRRPKLNGSRIGDRISIASATRDPSTALRSARDDEKLARVCVNDDDDAAVWFL